MSRRLPLRGQFPTHEDRYLETIQGCRFEVRRPRLSHHCSVAGLAPSLVCPPESKVPIRQCCEKILRATTRYTALAISEVFGGSQLGQPDGTHLSKQPLVLREHRVQ